jgi:hypothetical protein
MTLLRGASVNTNLYAACLHAACSAVRLPGVIARWRVYCRPQLNSTVQRLSVRPQPAKVAVVHGGIAGGPA